MIDIRCECGTLWSPGLSICNHPKYRCPKCQKIGPPDKDGEAMIIVFGALAGFLALMAVV